MSNLEKRTQFIQAATKKFESVRGKLDYGVYFDRSDLDKTLAELELQGYWKEEDAGGQERNAIFMTRIAVTSTSETEFARMMGTAWIMMP